MAPVISLVTTTGRIADPFTLTGTGFGALAGALYLFPDRFGEYSNVTPLIWSDTTITGLIPEFGTVPAAAAFFLVVPLNEVIGAKSPDFPLLSTQVVAAAQIIDGQFAYAPGGTPGTPIPIPFTNRGEPIGLLTDVNTGEGTSDGHWAIDATRTDDFVNITGVALSALRIRGSLVKAQQVALGNAFYGVTRFFT